MSQFCQSGMEDPQSQVYAHRFFFFDHLLTDAKVSLINFLFLQFFFFQLHPVFILQRKFIQWIYYLRAQSFLLFLSPVVTSIPFPLLL